MRIAFVSSSVPKPRTIKRVNSLSKVSNSLFAIFWERKHGYDYSAKEIEGIDVVRLKTSSRGNLLCRTAETHRLSRLTYSTLVEKKPDLLYISGIEAMFSALKYREHCGTKIILEIADLPASATIERLGYFGKFLSNKIDKLVFSANGLVFTSPYFLWNYYATKKEVSTIDYFIYENLPNREHFVAFRKKPHQKFVIGFVGGVRHYDSLIALFEACKDFEDVEILVAGVGPAYNAVLESAKAYRNVTLTGPYSYSESIADIYSSVDLVYSVYPSDRLNNQLALPNKLYEAIVCEIPILVSEDTKLGDYVKELGVGFTVKEGKPQILRHKIKSLLENPDLIEGVRAKSAVIRDAFFYESVEEDFSKWITDHDDQASKRQRKPGKSESVRKQISLR